LTFAAGVMAIFVFMFTSANAALRDGLVEYWGLDGDNSAKVDPSHVVTLQTTGSGSAAFVPGKFGQGIDLKNSVGNQAYVVIGGNENDFDFAGGSMSFSFWYTTRSLYAQYQCLLGKGENAAWRVARVTTSNTNIKLSVSGASGNGQIDKQDGSWHHLVGMYDATSGTKLYVDGSLVGSTTAAYTLINVPTAMQIGGNPQAAGRAWDGTIDDIAVWNRALTADEVAAIWNGGAGASIGELTGLGDSPKPLHPSPDNEATDVQRNVVLSWAPGIYASTHDVYLGTNRDDVNDARRNDPRNVLVSPGQVDATYAPPVRLEFGTTYYWRIDEVNAPPDNTIYRGDIWQFTVETFAYPIENITATASSSDVGMGPGNTVNGSGLGTDDLHSTASTDMWLSSSTGPQPTWIQYEFDKAYKLHEMWVWNYNAQFENIIGFGLKDVTVQYSTNGVEWKALSDVRFAWGPGAAGYAHDTIVDFGGVVAKYVKITAKSNWGGLAQYGLSEVRFFYIPVWAREPNPASGATGVGVDNATVSWRAGREAASHKVHFSTSRKAVIDETISPISIPADSSYGSYNVGALDLGRTYYWKVNEVNQAEIPTIWEGDIWNFKTAEYLVVDDFESYTADVGNRIFQTWRDGYGFTEPPPGYLGNGTGSGVGNEQSPWVERTIRHGGGQSMPLGYDNSGAGGKARYSETFREWASPQDWTRYNIKALTLYFYGAAANSAEQLYVALEDNAGRVKVMNYADPAAVQKTAWQEWNIALSEFSAAGVNVKAVKKMYIGLGNRASPTAGGTGTIYIDDIRLYPARCLAELRQPEADLNDDCVVDFSDLDVMVNQWLTSGHLVTPVDPGTASLQAQYQFEGNTNDGSGKGRNGTAIGGPLFVAGKVGQAISLDGTDDYVTIAGYKGILADAGGVQQPFTITAWGKTTDSGDRTIASWGTNSNMQRVDFRLASGRLRVEHGAGNVQGDTTLNDNNWHHVALTVIRGATISYPDVQLWLDGKDNTRASTDPDAFSITAGVDMAIGYRATAADRYFLGAIDDVRLYDRALSQAEVVWLAGITAPFSKPFDLNVDGAVNFKDFAVLADSWLEELLWP
jgi:hypothetical protein